MVRSVMLFEASGLRVSMLDDATDREAVTELSAACADYALMVTGAPPTPQDGERFFQDCPPGRSLDTMLKLGVRGDSNTLRCLIDVVRDYPEPGIWYIGLLMVHPTDRRTGLGRSLIEGLARHAAGQGAQRLSLGVVEANNAALAFWTALGFTECRRTRGQRIGSLDHLVIEMDRTLVPASRIAALQLPDR
ncbi:MULTISPECIES: GNAT family N-acetyltransferase [Acidiphilium]|uniref:Acetyltransferase (GNAT) family protein n=1 Tax=Acidiphilium rubrum TaxID=526 RepID=A0A8G2FDK6_ACIRU|nr:MULTISPECIES: GNAT family N-acetyltransferase [Acidiphilium]SIQ50035.1 Acetyltransferase (GNAT) family protein [Acidiphilium rubrum]